MKKILVTLLCLTLIMTGSACGAAEDGDIISAERPVFDGGAIRFSITSKTDADDVLTAAALYSGGRLEGVKVNTLNGEFAVNSGDEYMMKIFAWERDTLRPLTSVLTFDGLKAGDKRLPGEELDEIPASYYTASAEPGTLEELYYDTYESFSYESKTRPLTKRAIVYLPYGYDEGKKYNIFYYMHGGWSNETTSLGVPGRPSAFKNVIDNAIANGEMQPMIIVCPTYNNTNENGQDSDNFSLALQLNRQFHNELVNDLMPAAESRYSTYAADVTPEGLAASRRHRGFGGFSMGSVATWRTFQNCLDYFYYFMPMSCGTSLDDENIFSAAEGRDQSDYFVWVMTGTNDFAYSYVNNRVNKMRGSKYFTENENFIYRVKEGYDHGGLASMEYSYNGLKYFWNEYGATGGQSHAAYTAETKISDVISDPAFGDYGRLLFPVNSGYYGGSTLGDLSMTWYNYIDPDKTVEIANYMKSHAEAGDTVFYDIYTEAEKTADPAKRNIGLFFFRGEPGAKFAICNAGGGFAYVGAMHDSFPHALELSKKGYNAFALIYRPGWDTAMEDLARAIAFVHENAGELQVDVAGYSLWGGSAGARMAADLGTYGTAYYGEKSYPKPAAVIMQYTGHSEVTGDEPPTYSCVGTSDSIANYRTMERRINAIKANGTDAEIEVFAGLPHGFGLGTGTVAEGWLDNAVAFWERNM